MQGEEVLGPRVGNDSKDKQGHSHMVKPTRESNMKACHTMNQRSTNVKGGSNGQSSE
jgi:hypothetical protein